MLDIAFVILMAFLYCALFAWAVTYIVSYGLSGLRGAISAFSGFSVGGFSARRLAYVLAYVFMIFNAVMTPLHWWVSWRGDDVIMAAVVVLSLATFALGFFVSRERRGGFLPFAISVIFFINHSLLCKA